MNNFGEYFLTLPKKIDDLGREIQAKTREQRAMNEMWQTLDKKELLEGKLTDDELLDAAICLSIGSRENVWIKTSKFVYEKLTKLDAQLSQLKGETLVLYDSTKDRSHYNTVDLTMGIVEQPKIFVDRFLPLVLGETVRIDKLNRFDLHNSVRLFLQGYKHEKRFTAPGYFTRTIEDVGNSRLDITDLFSHFNLENGISYPTAGHGMVDGGIMGLFIGAEEIRRHLERHQAPKKYEGKEYPMEYVKEAKEFFEQHS